MIVGSTSGQAEENYDIYQCTQTHCCLEICILTFLLCSVLIESEKYYQVLS